jgi:ABC-2 type transport system ATP-binding protein
MIQLQHLVKWYGPTRAVHDLSCVIPAGRIIGFLGPNGAGKSTTLRIITGYMPPTSGRVTVDGLDVLTQSQQARTRIGYLPESNALYGEMRVEEYLHYRGKLHGMDRARRRQRINVVCEQCGLGLVRRRLIGQLSKGNRQRVGLAQALLHDPPVLILDEPTSGLDPSQISHFRQLIAELKGKHTLLLSTHILREVEASADEVIIIARGRMVAHGSIESLRQQARTDSRIMVELKASPDAVAQVFGRVEGVEQATTAARDGWCTATVTPRPGSDPREALGRVIATNGWVVREMRHEKATLEELYAEITAQQDQAVAEAA